MTRDSWEQNYYAGSIYSVRVPMNMAVKSTDALIFLLTHWGSDEIYTEEVSVNSTTKAYPTGDIRVSKEAPVCVKVETRTRQMVCDSKISTSHMKREFARMDA